MIHTSGKLQPRNFIAQGLLKKVHYYIHLNCFFVFFLFIRGLFKSNQVIPIHFNV